MTFRKYIIIHIWDICLYTHVDALAQTHLIDITTYNVCVYNYKIGIMWLCIDLFSIYIMV